jgi:hypothetical protein
MTKQKQQAPVKPSQQINKFFSSSLIKKQTVKQPTKPKPVKIKNKKNKKKHYNLILCD